MRNLSGNGAKARYLLAYNQARYNLTVEHLSVTLIIV